MTMHIAKFTTLRDPTCVLYQLKGSVATSARTSQGQVFRQVIFIPVEGTSR